MSVDPTTVAVIGCGNISGQYLDSFSRLPSEGSDRRDGAGKERELAVIFLLDDGDHLGGNDTRVASYAELVV